MVYPSGARRCAQAKAEMDKAYAARNKGQDKNAFEQCAHAGLVYFAG